MYNKVLSWTTLALVAAAAGCTMCAHPYDYCGPTFTGGPCQACMPNARSGSILSPAPQLMSDTAVMPDGEMVDGQIISVTDGRIDEQASAPPYTGGGQGVVQPRRTSRTLRATRR